MFVISNAMATVDPVAASFEMNHFEKSILILKFGKKSIFFYIFAVAIFQISDEFNRICANVKIRDLVCFRIQVTCHC